LKDFDVVQRSIEDLHPTSLADGQEVTVVFQTGTPGIESAKIACIKSGFND
jgi:hypothetical protein